MTRPLSLSSPSLSPSVVIPNNNNSYSFRVFLGRLSVWCTNRHLVELLAEYFHVMSVIVEERSLEIERYLPSLDETGEYSSSSSPVVVEMIPVVENIATATISASSMTYAEQVIRTFDGQLFMGRFLR